MLDLKKQQEKFDTDPEVVTIGPVNGARIFNGEEMEIFSAFSCLSNSKGCSSGLTMAFWINILHFEGNETFVLRQHDDNYLGVVIKVFTNHKNNFLQILITNDGSRCKVQSAFNTSTWNHVAFTYKKKKGIQLFMNGKKDSDASSCEDKPKPIGQGMPELPPSSFIGSHNLTMLLDDVVFWDKRLDENEVLDLIDYTVAQGKKCTYTPNRGGGGLL